MIKLEDLLLTVYCDVAIMDNIYPMITINITARIKSIQNIRTLEDRR